VIVDIITTSTFKEDTLFVELSLIPNTRTAADTLVDNMLNENIMGAHQLGDNVDAYSEIPESGTDSIDVAPTDGRSGGFIVTISNPGVIGG
jgi:hypothetical protein